MIPLDWMPPLMFAGLILSMLIGYPVAFTLSALGLSHSPRREDVMFEVEQPAQRRFSEAESIALRMMYAHRRPGNFFPDRDPAVGASSSVSGTFVITDRLRR